MTYLMIRLQNVSTSMHAKQCTHIHTHAYIERGREIEGVIVDYDK